MVRNYCRAEQRMMLQCFRCSCCGDDGDGPLFFALQLNKEQRQMAEGKWDGGDRPMRARSLSQDFKPPFVLTEINCRNILCEAPRRRQTVKDGSETDCTLHNM